MSAREGPDDSLIDEFGEFLEIDEILVNIHERLIEIRNNTQPGTDQVVVETDGKRVNVDVTENQIHRSGSGEDIASETVTESFVVPTQSDKITIHAEDADDDFEVIVRYQNSARQTRTDVDSSEDQDLGGGAGTPVFTNVDTPSPFIEIEFDHTGTASSNKINYNILAR